MSNQIPIDEKLIKYLRTKGYRSDNIIESYRKFYASKPRMRYPADKIPSWFKKYRGDKEYQIV